MNDKIFHSSLTRITDLERAGFDRRPLPREQWEAGDYVVGTATILRVGPVRGPRRDERVPYEASRPGGRRRDEHQRRRGSR